MFFGLRDELRDELSESMRTVAAERDRLQEAARSAKAQAHAAEGALKAQRDAQQGEAAAAACYARRAVQSLSFAATVTTIVPYTV